MTTITKNIVNKTKNVVVAKILSTRKNIEIIKRRSRLFIFKIKTKKNKKILEKNDFWIKKILSSASTRNVNYDVMIHEMKMKKMSQNMKKKNAKTFTKINASIHSRMKINKIEWLIKKSVQKKYAFLIARIVNAKKTNKLIENEMCHESNIKTTQFYDSKCKVYQCLKCQKYDHKIYECKNNQKCVYCALNHKSKLCSHKQVQNIWKCETCRDVHKIFDSRCYKRQIEKKKIKEITKNKSIYHVIRKKNTLNAISILIQLKTTIEFNSTTINDFKRKKTQKRSSKKNREHDVVAISTKIILNRLIKKHKSNKQLNSIRETTNSFNNDVSTSIISTSLSIDDLNILKKTNVSQTRKNTQNEKNDIWCLDEMSSKYYNTTFTNQKIK